MAGELWARPSPEEGPSHPSRSAGAIHREPRAGGRCWRSAGARLAAHVSRCCPPAAAALLRGLVGSAFLCLARNMSLCGGPAACAAGPSGSPAARLRAQGLRLPDVPGAEPQRANELLLLLPPPSPPPPAGEGPGSGQPPPQPQHHVVYFPGDVQVPARAHPCLGRGGWAGRAQVEGDSEGARGAVRGESGPSAYSCLGVSNSSRSKAKVLLSCTERANI